MSGLGLLQNHDTSRLSKRTGLLRRAFCHHGIAADELGVQEKEALFSDPGALERPAHSPPL